MTAAASERGLQEPVPFVGQRQSVASVIGEVWGARYLVSQFALRDIMIRYTQAVMGFAWALLMPLLIVGAGMMFRVVLSVMSNTRVEGSSIAALAAKALPWAFFSAALNTATQSIISNANLVAKVYFPREALPLASVLAQLPDLLVGLTILGIAFPIIGVPMSWALLWLPVIIVLLIGFTVGFALLLSCANLFYRDVKYIVQVVLNFGMFATPVFFEPQMLGPKGARIMMALPLSPYIQAMDIAMVRGRSLLSTVVMVTSKGPAVVWAPWMFAYALIAAMAVLFVGVKVFRRGSSRFAEMA